MVAELLISAFVPATIVARAVVGINILAGRSVYQVGLTATIQLIFATYHSWNMHRMAAVALLLNEHRWAMICLGWCTLGTAFVLCEVVLFLLISLLENPDTVSWRVGFFVAASVPGIVLLYFERSMIAWERSARLAAQEPTLPLNTDPELPHPPEGQLQPSRCSLCTRDDRKL